MPSPLRSLHVAVVAAAVLAMLAMDGSAQGQAKYEPAPENLAARQWFQDARFGLFVHWGVYSLLADGEWVMNQRKIPAKDYEKIPASFNPVAFDPAEWVSLVKAAGMKYITITSKHHDGFAMFDSKVTDWDIVDRTPYKKDVLKMLADECHRQGIKLFFYHSQLDWHHPDYFPRGRTGQDAGRPESGDFNRYIDFMNAQLTELLTNYGDVAGVWFDGWWDRPDANWRLDETYTLIHRLKPAALIGSNHHRRPFPGEDFQMFEKDLPGHNTAGFNEQSEIGNLPLEYCDTISGAWGFNINDRGYKDTKALVHMLARAAGYNSNLLLNVGPMPDGRIQPEFVERLREVGGWLRLHGESIYGTRGGPISPRPWGVTTRRDNMVYVHVLDWPDEAILVPPLGAAVKSAKLLKTGAAVAARNLPEGVLIPLPKTAPDPYDTVIALELEGGKATN
jgi:alpha-L-fucosidase